MKVVLLRPGDEALLCRAEAAFNDAPSAERAAMLLREPTFVMVVALTGDGEIMSRIYGHVLHRYDTSDLFLYEVDTAEAHKRKGAARALIDFLKGLAAERGYGEMWVPTEIDNDAANALYRSTGGIADAVPANTYVYDLEE